MTRAFDYHFQPMGGELPSEFADIGAELGAERTLKRQR
jgi:hypothetical protein